MRKYLFITSMLLAVLMFSTASFAAPGLCITKPPVFGPPNTGPTIDPPATQGQWFMDLRTGIEQPRMCEFYDNVYHQGGGWRSHLAIAGYVVQINFDPLQNITDFFVDVTITNDMPAVSQWIGGHNRHDEFLPFMSMEEQIQEIPMLNVKWTASFADDGVLMNFPMSGPPYLPAPPPLMSWLGSPESNVYANPFFMEPEFGYDELAWYCWTPDPNGINPQKDGKYMVPTWDFGNIMPQQSVTRRVHFWLYQPVPMGHPLYQFLMTAYFERYDILLNRSTSLKVSDYFDTLAYDLGIPYPEEEPYAGSDCSVFFDIEIPQVPIIDDVYRDHLNKAIVLVFTNMQPGWIYGLESSIQPYDPNYNEANMIWNLEWIGPMVNIWIDINCPPLIGPEKYYRLFVMHPCGGRIYCPDTVGAMSIWCNVGRNMVSSPFEPYPDGGLSGGGIMGQASLNKIVGPQLTGHNLNRALSDNIEKWINALGAYQRSWYKTMPAPGNWMDWNGGAPLFGISSDTGYWFNIISGHPAVFVTFCGRVSKMNRSIPIAVGRNLVGSCFPVSCPLSQSNLVGSGFTGHGLNRALSDNVEFWNNITGSYERFWYKTMPAPGSWQPWNVGQPLRTIMPGDAIWVNVIAGHLPFMWNYLVPPRPGFAP